MAKRHSPANTKLRHQIKSLRAHVSDLEAMVRNKIPLRPVVFSFAMTMEKVMRDNDKEKGNSWMEMDVEELVTLFYAQMEKACKETNLPGEVEDPKRLINIANYAMMLYHRTKKEEE